LSHDQQVLSTYPLKDRPMMKALIRDRYGPPDVLEVRDIEPPAPKEREVLVRVYAASINDWDWQMLQRPMLLLGFNRPRVRIWVPTSRDGLPPSAVRFNVRLSIQVRTM